MSDGIIELSTKIAALSARARSSLAQNNRTGALSALRSRKLAEKTLLEREQKLNTLEEIYSKIRDAKDQIAMVQVMQSSTTVLKNLHAQTGGIERVEDIVSDLREEMENVAEVESVLASASAVDASVEQEVDEELEKMERQAEAEIAKQKQQAEQAKEEAREKEVEASLAALGRLSIDVSDSKQAEKDKATPVASAN
jgi:charged multivesicular body protein 7